MLQVPEEGAAVPSEVVSEVISEAASAVLAEAPLVEVEQADRGRTTMLDIKKSGMCRSFSLLLRFPFKNLYYLAYKRMPYNILLVEIYHTYPFQPLEH